MYGDVDYVPQPCCSLLLPSSSRHCTAPALTKAASASGYQVRIDDAASSLAPAKSCTGGLTYACDRVQIALLKHQMDTLVTVDHLGDA